MKLRTLSSRLAALAAGLSALLLTFCFVARPWYLGWGATELEKEMPLPGDDIVSTARTQETRAIGIAASADLVWPWVAQIGQDRGGFYSYEILEDLVGCEMPRVEHLDLALQSWKVGDKLWMYPPDKANGAGHVLLKVMEPGRALGFASRQIGTPLSAPYDGSWSFVVRPIDDLNTRLVFRGRAAGGSGAFATALGVLGFEPVHFAMERRTLETIKGLAEGRRPSVLAENLQVLSWTLVFVAFVASAMLLMRGRRPEQRLVTFVASGFVFMLLTLFQPTPWLGMPLAVVLVLATFGRGRLPTLRRHRPRRGSVANVRVSAFGR